MYRFAMCKVCGGSGWLTDKTEKEHILCPVCNGGGCVLRPTPDKLVEAIKKARKDDGVS